MRAVPIHNAPSESTNMSAFTALVRKDLKLHFSNRRAVIMSIVAPILIAAFFGSLFGDKAAKPSNIPIAITDLDHSAVSAKVVAALHAESALVVSDAPADEALAQVRAGKLRAAVVLPVASARRRARRCSAATASPRSCCTTTRRNPPCCRWCAGCSRNM